ncbi:hypothetical protein CLU79DRAFT_718764 [Phycomyces nitens]|nr:hypothetical protein CLU79DRAFT_718764 [Phycomyces nitens]
MVNRRFQNSDRVPTCMNPLAQDDVRCPPARVLSRRAPSSATSGEYAGYCGPVATAGGSVAPTGGPVAPLVDLLPPPVALLLLPVDLLLPLVVLLLLPENLLVLSMPQMPLPPSQDAAEGGKKTPVHEIPTEYKRGSTTSGKAQSWVTPTVKKSSRIWAQPRTHCQPDSKGRNPTHGQTPTVKMTEIEEGYKPTANPIPKGGIQPMGRVPQSRRLKSRKGNDPLPSRFQRAESNPWADSHSQDD